MIDIQYVVENGNKNHKNSGQEQKFEQKTKRKFSYFHNKIIKNLFNFPLNYVTQSCRMVDVSGGQW